jgi:hypothetical protein
MVRFPEPENNNFNFMEFMLQKPRKEPIECFGHDVDRECESSERIIADGIKSANEVAFPNKKKPWMFGD